MFCSVPPFKLQGNQDKASASSPLLIEKLQHKYSWARGVSRGSEATQAQHRKDLEKAFAEIDGMIAGNTFLDGMQSPQPAFPSTQSDYGVAAFQADQERTEARPDIADEISEEDFFEEEESPQDEAAPKCPDPGTEPTATQWAAMMSLREEMEHHHRRFESLPCVSQDPILSQLLRIFRDPKTIRKSGMLVLRDILRGFSPTKLKDVFAFASLSYAVSQRLFKEGRIEENQILEGLRVWRDVIVDKGEREAFVKVAQELWPESRNHLHFMPLPDVDLQDALNEPFSRFGQSVDSIPLQAQDDLSGPRPTSTTQTQWPDAYDSTALGPELMNYQALDLTGMSNEAWGFSSFLLGDFNNATYPPMRSDMEGNSQLFDPMGPNPTQNPDTHLESATNSHEGQVIEVQDSQLSSTVVFLVVVAFLADIQDLLCILSGRGRVCKPDNWYSTEEEDHRRFYKTAKEEFFKVRWDGSSGANRQFNALLCVAKLLTRQGSLRTMDDIRYYLVSIAPAVFPPGEQFQQFVLWVMLKDPSQIRPDKPSRCERPKDHRRLRKSHICDTCGHTCQTASGLHKHKREVHQQAEVIQCPDCTYNNVRRDRVRSHFLGYHRRELPEFLQGNGRRGKAQQG